ncbi:unnamed protein product [Toxocara canis]|uniref:RxLR effector candidate protein n=1 Tax=Toxocara canis TaxID=6265 RepID=A0A183UHT8_TOXCA|nr:unnamed protein product [Toxocara canis]
MVVLGCLPLVVIPLLSFSAAVQAPRHYHSTGLVDKHVDNNLGKHLSSSALFKRSPRVSAVAVNTTVKERIAKRFVYNVPPIPITLPKPELVEDTSTTPLEQRDSYTEAEHRVLVTDRTDTIPDDSDSSIPTAVSKSDVEEQQPIHKTTAELPTGSADETALLTRKEAPMIEATRLSALTSATEEAVNHDNASYSDDVLLSANDTSEARTKGSLPLRINKRNNRTFTELRVDWDSIQKNDFAWWEGRKMHEHLLGEVLPPM